MAEQVNKRVEPLGQGEMQRLEVSATPPARCCTEGMARTEVPLIAGNVPARGQIFDIKQNKEHAYVFQQSCERCNGPKNKYAGRLCRTCYMLGSRNGVVTQLMEISEMAKFQVDKNVAVPATRAQETPYPFDSMQIGDSFLIPYPEDATESEVAIFWNRSQGSVSQSFRNWRMAAPKEREHLMLTTRSMEDGLRCWVFRKPWAEQAGDNVVKIA